MDNRTNTYAHELSRLIQLETISVDHQLDISKFYEFQKTLREIFPVIFQKCTFEDFRGSFLMRWPGKHTSDPILFMNHQDVVEAPGAWKYPPFSGTIADRKLWGRGTLDAKGGLWAMLRAANELAESGFIPNHDIYFVSGCNEETDGSGAEEISRVLQQRGLRFRMVLDEGGMIMHEPIGGANGTFAMVGVGEKGCVDLKFVARSSGGHASTPGKNTPLVRLGKFMAAVERSNIFKADISPAVNQMFKRISATMKQPLRFILGHPGLFKPLLLGVIPSVSATAGAMLKTTIAFTMASGSEGFNVLPHEAWIIGNMRYSHHQGEKDSIRAIKKLAKKYDIDTVVLEPGFSSPLSDYDTDAFHIIEKAISTVFPGVYTSPYIMTGASDCRFMSRVSDHCYRFAPFQITDKQLDSIHGIDENIDLKSLAPAVDFFKYLMTEA